ncbi:flavin reductase family protein [Arenibacterium halophilum]|uniref:Flavin reductase family protein n=1 Tax=Arenibacterium halophilum TaxID=2583821 RepID=A0ABY2XBC1_9RHOB|nr:flavin reductase family protein [Arenibacterium halophilum]TMV13358.1 flavin reductase family protein [Arenibacterium halophilum]
MTDTPYTSHVPSHESRSSYREALGCYGTGVTVVSTTTPDGPLAMTANSFASVSLEPPLVLWCPARASARHDPLAQARDYVIHVMGAEQRDLASHFARSGDDFDGIDWQTGATGQPVLADCLARFECRRYSTQQAGDHSIVLGKVLRFWHRPGMGLMFKRGQFGGFSEL